MMKVFKVIKIAGKIYLIADLCMWAAIGIGEIAEYEADIWDSCESVSEIYNKMQDKLDEMLDNMVRQYKKFGKIALKKKKVI